jgi:hypothetical protein
LDRGYLKGCEERKGNKQKRLSIEKGREGHCKAISQTLRHPDLARLTQTLAAGVLNGTSYYSP